MERPEIPAPAKVASSIVAIACLVRGWFVVMRGINAPGHAGALFAFFGPFEPLAFFVAGTIPSLVVVLSRPNDSSFARMVPIVLLGLNAISGAFCLSWILLLLVALARSAAT